MKPSRRLTGREAVVSVLAAGAVAVGATITGDTLASPANHAGSIGLEFGRRNCRPSINKNRGKEYATRPIDLYKTSKRTNTATKAAGEGGAQNPAQTGKASGKRRGRDGRAPRTRCSTGGAIQHWRGRN